MNKHVRVIRKANAKTDYECIKDIIVAMHKNSENGLKITIQENNMKRKDAQNALMWMWHREFIKHRYETAGEVFTAEQWHEVWKQAFLGTGEPVKVNNQWVVPVRSSTNLSVGEMSKVLSQYQAEAAQDNCMFTQPPDIYFQAMCEQIEKEEQTDGL